MQDNYTVGKRYVPLLQLPNYPLKYSPSVFLHSAKLHYCVTEIVSTLTW